MDGIDFRQHGYLFLLDRPEDVARFREALALQHALGVPSRELSVDDALAIVPQLDPEGLLAATYCELDGYATPEAVVQWYARGLDVRQGCEVTGIDVEGGRVDRRRDVAGADRRGAVVCCAGAWSREVAALAGVELPVEGEKRWMWFTPEDGGLPRAAAADDRLHHLVLLPPRRARARLRREGADARGGRRARRRGGCRVLAELPVQSSWWGYYEISPDWNALVGETAESGRVLLRDRLLGPRLPAGAGGRRARRGAGRRAASRRSTCPRSTSRASSRGSRGPRASSCGRTEPGRRRREGDGHRANEANLQRAFEAWNARDLDGYLDLYDEGIRLHGYSPEPMGKSEVRGFARAAHRHGRSNEMIQTVVLIGPQSSVSSGVRGSLRVIARHGAETSRSDHCRVHRHPARHPERRKPASFMGSRSASRTALAPADVDVDGHLTVEGVLLVSATGRAARSPGRTRRLVDAGWLVPLDAGRDRHRRGRPDRSLVGFGGATRRSSGRCSSPLPDDRADPRARRPRRRDLEAPPAGGGAYSAPGR